MLVGAPCGSWAGGQSVLKLEGPGDEKRVSRSDERCLLAKSRPEEQPGRIGPVPLMGDGGVVPALQRPVPQRLKVLSVFQPRGIFFPPLGLPGLGRLPRCSAASPVVPNLWNVDGEVAVPEQKPGEVAEELASSYERKLIEDLKSSVTCLFSCVEGLTQGTVALVIGLQKPWFDYPCPSLYFPLRTISLEPQKTEQLTTNWSLDAVKTGLTNTDASEV
ncbi:hypothetical protein CB1_001431016 [Camelus ferus]|nr:hypothetical protein CB1_001431016 [Camelus ferus]